MLTTRFAPTTRGFIPPAFPGGAFAERLAGELEEDLFEVGLANVQAEQRRPGVLDGVQYLLDVVRVLHPDLDVFVVVMDRLEAHLPDDFKDFFIDGLQREDQVIRVAFDELPGRAHRDDLPLRDDGDRVGKKLRFLHVVRGEKHRRPLLLQAQQDVPHLAPRAGVEPRRRLVEEHDLGIVHERNRDSEALLQAPGEVLVLLFGLVLEVRRALSARRHRRSLRRKSRE